MDDGDGHDHRRIETGETNLTIRRTFDHAESLITVEFRDVDEGAEGCFPTSVPTRSRWRVPPRDGTGCSKAYERSFWNRDRNRNGRYDEV